MEPMFTGSYHVEDTGEIHVVAVQIGEVDERDGIGFETISRFVPPPVGLL